MKWGVRYNYNYVNNLYDSIKRHTSKKTQLICFLYLLNSKLFATVKLTDEALFGENFSLYGSNILINILNLIIINL